MKHVTLNSKGFTLIEVIVSVAIFSLIAYGLLELVSSIMVNSSQQSNLLANNDSARRVAFNLMKELRNAQTSATGAYPVSVASSQTITFYSNTGTTVDRIRYYISNGTLYKGVTKPTGNPAVYIIDQEVNTLLQKDLANGVNPLFYYYDGTYNGVTDNFLASPVNVTDVKLVKINMSIYKKGRASTTATYSVTASGSIRNLKTNLGQ